MHPQRLPHFFLVTLATFMLVLVAWVFQGKFLGLRTPLRFINPALALGEGIPEVPYEPGSEPGDIDCDGIPDNEDPDKDGDGLDDLNDDTDDNGDGCEDGSADPCEPTCFVAGTPVLMADGSAKPIDQLSKGESVVVVDEDTGQQVASSIQQTIAHPSRARDLYRLVFSTGASVEVTGEHSIYEPSLRKYLTVFKLVDRFNSGWPVTVWLADGARAKLADVAIELRNEPVYNIHVEGLGPNRAHNYFANGILVHNSGEGKPDPCASINSNTNEDAGTK